MARKTGKTLEIDLRPAIESLGLRHVIEQIGTKRVVEEIGLDDFLANLSAAKRAELKRRLQRTDEPGARRKD